MTNCHQLKMRAKMWHSAAVVLPELHGMLSRLRQGIRLSHRKMLRSSAPWSLICWLPEWKKAGISVVYWEQKGRWVLWRSGAVSFSLAGSRTR